jgi:2-desacetyl-2-hydroxyethyl bacteriochlorophyllide A dehydrogenase
MDNAITTRAVWFAAPRIAELRTEIVPPPGPHELRIAALASAISHGTEMLVYRGSVPPDLPLDLPTLAGSFAFPIKYGYASVGRVRDVGSDVAGWNVGDLAFTLHPHQGVYVVPAHLAHKLPPDLDPLRALFLANLETAINIVHDTPLALGDTAIVFGQGVVGLLVAQLLKLAGAARVLAAEPIARRQQLARDVGVDAILTPKPDLADHIRAANNGRLADVAIEASGAPAALQSAIDSVLPEGTVVVASWYGSKVVPLMLGGAFHRGRVTLRSSQVGRLNPALAPRWDYARRLHTAIGFLPRLRLVELITHSFPLSDAPAAYQLIDGWPEETGQVMLTYDKVNVGTWERGNVGT